MAGLSALAQSGKLAARVDTQKLLVYTQAWKATLYPTSHGDAYRLGYVAPLAFKDQEQLAQRALIIGTTGMWYSVPHVRLVPQRFSSYWPQLLQAWQQHVQMAPATMPAHHERYLDLLTEVIEATRDIEIARQEQTPAMPYRQVATTRELRHSGSSTYTFHLTDSPTIGNGTAVFLPDRPDLRGRVLRNEGRRITVRFERAIDFNLIPPQGTLKQLPSDRVYQVQLSAVETLRAQKSAQPRLLSCIVDRELTPYHPVTDARPVSSLDNDQLRAFAKALSTPDLVLVLGPPGTGKTRTITEIATAAASRGQRVLVTSQTNRAVDNVLERLPEHVRAIRVGNEDAMSTRARGYLADIQVERLREQILRDTEGTLERLDYAVGADSAVDRWLSLAASDLRAASAATTDLLQGEAELNASITFVMTPFAPDLAALTGKLEAAAAILAAADSRQQRAEHKLKAAEQQTAGPLGFVFRWLSSRHQRTAEQLSTRLATATSIHLTAQEALTARQSEAERVVAVDPQVRALRQVRDNHLRVRDESVKRVAKSLDAVRELLRPAIALPPSSPADLAGLNVQYQQLNETTSLAKSRLRLITQWRDQVDIVDEQLQHELIRYADVVAATCIGTATTKLLADQTFDLAIVDEAGQIAAPNLLVPLVRSKRAVLVGDHHQLPPFLDDDVSTWAQQLVHRRQPGEVEQIGDLLRRSEFERLYVGTSEANRAMLTVQRRMPEEIACLVSSAFYQGILGTDHNGRTPDPVFRSPLAMIDTSDRPARERADRQPRVGQGSVNDLEARLIVRVLRKLVPHYGDWAVIAPYKAQVELIGRLVAQELPDVVVADHVGTVDSFQGGERDLIVYGFTRSNARGDVGFLKELRRINVAITRARKQLVLVGDTATLANSADPGFARLMQLTMSHLDAVGDLRPSREAEAALK